MCSLKPGNTHFLLAAAAFISFLVRSEVEAGCGVTQADSIAANAVSACLLIINSLL